MAAKIIVPGSAKNEYRTSEYKLIYGLLCAGHQPTRIEYDMPTIYYIFDEDECGDTIRTLCTNGTLMVPIQNVWSASEIWGMNLSRAKNDNK
jgi:hypothetical protein